MASGIHIHCPWERRGPIYLLDCTRMFQSHANTTEEPAQGITNLFLVYRDAMVFVFKDTVTLLGRTICLPLIFLKLKWRCLVVFTFS